MISFKERFEKSTRWTDKARLIEIYHLTQKSVNPRWTQKATGKYFELADETISEYMTLAKAMHDDIRFEHRFGSLSKEKALRSLGHYRYIKPKFKHLDDE